VGGFKKFLLRGNVVDLAVAVVIGTAFGAVVTAFVAAFVNPLIGVFVGAAGDFNDRSFTVGHTVFPYGRFVQAVLSFVIIAAVVYFLIVRPVQRLMDRFRTEPEADRPVQECPECLSKIPEGARRCAFCTAEQPGFASSTVGG
jgi:large conductance mechanosensitive channel